MTPVISLRSIKQENFDDLKVQGQKSTLKNRSYKTSTFGKKKVSAGVGMNENSAHMGQFMYINSPNDDPTGAQFVPQGTQANFTGYDSE